MRYVIVTLAMTMGLAGCKADPPGKLEAKIITSAEHEIFIGNKDQKNPLPDTPQTRADGKEAFSHYCVACHGNDGQNTGVPFIEHVSPPIPSLGISGRAALYGWPAEVDSRLWNSAVWNARLEGNSE